MTGSRTWTDTRVIRDALTREWGDGTAVLVVGACPRGADQLAEACWRAWGGRVERHPADWHEHGRSAGLVRNAAMVATGADVCLAFLHGAARGTRHTADLATRAGIPTHRYRASVMSDETTQVAQLHAQAVAATRSASSHDELAEHTPRGRDDDLHDGVDDGSGWSR